jgi:hypothetical protein
MGSTEVVFVQRYGSALNSNVHFHALLPDAVYFQGEGETLELITLPAPTDEQVRHLLGMIARRVTAHVQKAFATLDEAQDVLGGAIYAAMAQLSSAILPWPGDDEDPCRKTCAKKQTLRPTGRLFAPCQHDEAALLAVRRDKQRVGMREFEEAIDRVVAGLEKKGRLISEKERRVVAVHEVATPWLATCCLTPRRPTRSPLFRGGWPPWD